jgi:hypothetical protein
MSKHLIYTRRADAQALSHDEIYRLAPSVFAFDKSPRLTERYGQVTTSNAIGILADFGFYPVQAAQVGKTRHSKHMLAFASDFTSGNRPELILYNSHDGTSALKMFAGVFRAICSNGMVAGEGFKNRMLHTAGTVANFETMVTSTAARLPDLQEKIQVMRDTRLPTTDALEFIKQGATFRWKQERITDNTIGDIYQPRRIEDTPNDMWTVFNRLQEGLIRGGVRIKSGHTERKARAISSIQQNLAINTRLWDLV